MKDKSNSWEVIHLPLLLAYCGGNIRYYEGASSNRFLVQYDSIYNRQSAFPLFSVYPTPAPDSSITLSSNDVQAGDSISISRVAKTYAAYTRAHYESVYVTDPDGNLITDLVGNGTDFPYNDETGEPYAQKIDCGSDNCDGSWSATDPHVFNESDTLQTGDDWKEGTYTVHFVLYDGVARASKSGTNGEVTATFKIHNLPLPPQDPPQTNSDMTTTPVGEVKADSASPTGEKFDVKQGIPTSEYLYTKVNSKEYLFRYSFEQVVGQKTYKVHFKKTYIIPPPDPVPNPDGTMPPPGEPKTVPKDQTITVKRNFSYWVIKQLEVYKIKQADVNNYALDVPQKVTIPPDYTISMDVSHSDDERQHLQMSPADPSQEIPHDYGTVTLSPGESPPADEGWNAIAEADVAQITCKNDSLNFNDNGVSKLIMDDTPVQQPQSTPKPGKIDIAKMTADPVMYKNQIHIPDTLPNQARTSITGKVTYEKVDGSFTNNPPTPFDIKFDNQWVTVHTPVVNPSYSTDDWQHNQKTHATPGVSAMILDRPFHVYMPTVAEHLEIPGYRTRDYSKYTKKRQVRFPFDVFPADGIQPILARTWIDIYSDDTLFQMPVWVDERADYQVEFREIAINASSDNAASQTYANTDLSNYVAYKSIPVEVIGRLYDFRITDVADYNWQYVFRQSDGVSPTGAKYWIGYQNIDGNPRGNTYPYRLPILPGSSPLAGYDNTAVKTGYHFKFELKTKGNMFSIDDGIRITPSFFFIKRDGSGGRIPVDLYYRTNEQQFVQVGSTDDKVQRYVVLNDPLRNVNQTAITDTANYYFDHYNTKYTNRQSYVDQYLYAAGKKTLAGNYSLLELTAPLRTFDPPAKYYTASVDAQRQYASVQHWYGEYSLPAAPYVVPAGTKLWAQGPLNDHSKVFLHDGYIIVNFNIESIQHADINHPHLQYIHGEKMNQWSMEGFTSSATNKYGKPYPFPLDYGDVVFYDADKSSRDDFGSNVTH
ncbi:DUF5704 domain-containing protein [Tumebacillus flagellatus]|uniref:DUF5704 domain-containing protein n=1 Tax=Tumebacillus flagellatus TaxID=1157490 RepID=UPI000AE9D0A9|nr:DUF5704 domain-containing protein [Tumebacillus flagellatus]